MRVGIDLGTTNSVIAAVDEDGKANIIKNRDGQRITPSVVMFRDDSIIVGEQAKNNSIMNPYKVCQFVKRNMGNKSYSFEPTLGERYSSEEISALILKRLKEDAQVLTENEIDEAVVTVPAYFDDITRNATKDAATIAGFQVLGIINEPTAAALAYCHEEDASDGNYMVFDFGGGTFDVTILRVSNQKRNIDIISTYGERFLGGFDIDNFIIRYVMDEFEKEHGLEIDEDVIASQDLRIKAEQAKIRLTDEMSASVSIISKGKSLKVEITREKFENGIRDIISPAKDGMLFALEEAKLDWKDINKILLVGGVTKMPIVRRMIAECSGIEPSIELNPDEVVAKGAAYYAKMLSNKDTTEDDSEDIVLNDVSSHGLGIICQDVESGKDINRTVIQKNTPLPAKGDSEFYTLMDNQEYLYLKVLQGEDENPEYDTLIGTTILTLSPRPKNSPISVNMEYDINGIVHVGVTDLTDGKYLGEMHIDRNSNLSESEVEDKAKHMTNLSIG